MLKSNWRSLTAVSAGLFALVLFPAAAKAQMSVSPLVIEAKAERGQAQGMITISNTSKTPSRIRIYAEPFTYSRDAGFQTLSSSPNDLTKYLQFSPRELTVKPGEVRRVRLISRLAPNLPDGEYRAVVFNETLTESRDAAGNNVTLVARIGVTFYVRKGNLSPQLAIDSASFNPEQKQIQLLVRNSGQATVLPSLNWTLRQGQTVVKTGQIDTNAVVANSDRNFLLNYPNKDQPALKPGKYQLSGELFWGEDNNKSKLPFNVNITIPAQPAASQKK
ncbi:P pilus assembly protein, chaperone PapD [Nostoc sp. UCD121]|uniref:P pilus assembly protein, chaperone PapD n=1 Tax=unclassified Nostoc TaxID=2593658 RepID=UPI00162AB718|nr:MULTISPECIES: P pilus assembly protein, chaperone PapD [unclassified Nostoc]MBC1218909.1 P pilus assembly protein, chaperone PapD [Nostoc sp. UCD120]MBC1277356.1 P pilus assembly protein, chaperone PapD [Nostoc sp. UCD121]MBC1299226.1 P pilus assembly protein, chaperone PapD [Nostoc sp. UCD122]